VRRAFEATFRENVDLKTVDRVVKKWKSKGSILNQNKGNSGRKRSARTEENVATVSGRIQESSQSVRKMEAELGINRESIRRILRNDLHLKSYRLQTFQHLSNNDKERRLDFCQMIKNMAGRRQMDIKTIIFSDESHT
jgi:hypothetical protein